MWLVLQIIFQIENIIECERTQLKFELSDNPDSPENCYIEQALDELSKREEELSQRVKLIQLNL